MRIRTLLLAPLALFAAAPAVAQPDVAVRVDSLFRQWNGTTSPGCAVGVARNGSPVLRRAYGMADLEHDVPNTPSTVFEAGSVSKQFTAAAIVLLARQGRLSLDDDVRRWVPEVPDYGTPITLRNLLTHTSGLRDWGVVAELGGWPRGSRVHTHAHVLEIVSRQRELNFTPGAEYLYSNTGYNLLAIVAERASGTSLAEYSRREIFGPLGMTSTQWRDDYTRIVPGRAIAYGWREGGYRQQMPFENVYGNGGLLTTVDDLLRWNQALDSGTLAGLDTLETRGVLTSGRRIEYALGLMVGDHRGVREIAHSGATAGYRAYLARYPDAGLSVALLCNAGNGDPGALALRTAELYLADRMSDAAEAPASAPYAIAAAELERRAGLFRDRRTGAPLLVRMADGRLRTSTGAELLPVAPADFRLSSGAGRLEFTDAPDGLVRVVRPDGDTLLYEPAPAPDTSAAALAAYAGEYYGDEAQAAYTVEVANGRLLLRQRPDRTIPLLPAYADGFAGPGGAVVRFIRGADGRVEAFTITLERVRRLRFDRVER
jgi:CubicO group peptidase (beta-lactamase class C family)